MSFQNEKDADRRRKSEQSEEIESSRKSQTRKKSAGKKEVGTALRTIYQRTVEEDVPPDLLDLLGKLG